MKKLRCRDCNQPIAFLADDRGKRLIVEPQGVIRGTVRYNPAQHRRHDCPKRREPGAAWKRIEEVLSR